MNRLPSGLSGSICFRGSVRLRFMYASIFTTTIANAFKAIEGLDCGGVLVNECDFRVDAMPFGGIKNSGLGREGIKFALQEMTEPKAVVFNLN